MLDEYFADAHGVVPNKRNARIRALNTKAMQALLDEGKHVFLYPNNTYWFSGGLVMKDNSRIEGIASLAGFGGGAEMRFIADGFTGPCIGSTDDGYLYRAGLANVAVEAEGEYSEFMYLKQSVNPMLYNVLFKTDELDMGGILFRKTGFSNSSWTAELKGVKIRLPDESTAYCLDSDVSDSEIIGCSFTGGIGCVLRGSGGVRMIGSRLDRSNEHNLTISMERGTINSHIIIGNQFELANGHDILVDADGVEKYPEIALVAAHNNFRSDGLGNIRLKRTIPGTVKGGDFSGNLPAFNHDTDADENWLTLEPTPTALEIYEPAPVATSAPEPEKKKRGFFSRLFGWL